jgi:hypothetical protein
MQPFGGVVIGASDVEASAAFFETFCFERTSATTLRVPGGAPVDIVLAATDAPGRAPRGYELGPRALDLYTTDIERGLAVAADAGYMTSPIGTISMGPVTMRQALVTGPDGVPVVLVESTHRRSSILDREPDRLFSEPHSVVWAVDDVDTEAAWWVEQGATKGMDLRFSEPAVSEYLGLPDSPVEIRMTMISDVAVSPLRLELLEFVGRHPAGAAPTGPYVANAGRAGSRSLPISG